MSHSPGPWKKGEPLDNTTWIGTGGDDGYNFEVRNCDADLVMAAPDLLEALKSAQNLVWNSCSHVDQYDKTRTLFDDERGDLWRKISSAITKAEGGASLEGGVK